MSDEVAVKAEWPGRVAEVHVAAGQTVTLDQELITLESMKMLTPVGAPVAGTVSAVDAVVDAFVEQGEVIARITT